MTIPHTSRIETIAVHGGEPQSPSYGAAITPIYQSSVFEFRGGAGEFVRYPRYSNLPDQQALADALAALEGTEAALFTASGMAALAASVLSALLPGGHLLLLRGVYGGMLHFATRSFEQLGLSFDLIDGDKPDTWRAKLRPNTRAIYVESITNPLVTVPDLRAAVDFAREHGLVSLIDHTFTSPVYFKPVPFGFDVSLQSATKYLNGHSDLVAGCAAASAKWIDKIRDKIYQFGGSLDPHAVFLVRRGLKTLPLRIRRQTATALALAQFLESRPEIRRVHYPGLASSPYAARARELFGGTGGVLAYEPKGGVAAVERILARLKIPIVAPSLGGIETLTTRPVLTSHHYFPKEMRLEQGVTDELVRVAVGIEHADDLIADFAQALEGC